MSIELKDIGIKDSAVGSSFIYEPRISRVYANAFQSNARIEHVEIPDADSIDASTFVGCTALRQLVLPGLTSFNDIFGNDTNKKALSNLNNIEVRQKEGIADVDIGRVFSSLDGLTELKLPSTVKSIPAKAFSGTSLTSLLFGSSVSLSDNCLSGMPYLQRLQFDISKLPASGNIGLSSCPNLQAIYATASTSTVRQSTFSRTTAEYIQFANQGQSIQYLEESTFADCQHLHTIDFSNASITQVPRYAFKDCSNLSSVYFSPALTSLAEDSFTGCSIYNAKHGFDLAGIKDLHHVGKFATFYAYNINHTFDVVGPSAFMNLAVAQGDDAAQATSISLTAAHINAAAFSGIQSELTSLTLSTLNDSVPTNCFYGSYSLKKVSLHGPNLTAVGDHAFADCYSLTSVSYSDSSKIHYINSYAFANCYQLTSFSFSNGLTAIDDSAYSGCTQLKSIVFENPSILTIHNSAFAQCDSLTSLTFKTMVDSSISSSSIGWINVKEISFPTMTLEQFGHDYVPDNWFDKSSVNEKYNKLMAVFFAYTQAATSKTDVKFIFSDVVLQYDGIRTDYNCLKYADTVNKTQLTAIDTSEADINEFIKDRQLPSQISSVWSNAFSQIRSTYEYLQQFTSIDLNNTTTISDGSLSSMAYLETAMANALIAVSQKLFCDDIALKDVSIVRAQKIEASAFYNCAELTSIQSSQQLTSIDDAAFAKCTSLRNADFISNSVQSIGVSAFSEDTSLTSFQMPIADSQLTSIGNYAFNGCTALQKVVLPDKSGASPMALNSTVFLQCTSLSNVSIYGKKTIGSDTFKYCSTSLQMYFMLQDKNTVLTDYGIATTALTADSSNFGNPPDGASIYASDNNYTHPLLIAISTTELYIVQNAAFELEHIGDGKFRLVSIDPMYESSVEITSTMLNSITSIAVDAFKRTRTIQSIKFGIEFGSTSIEIPDLTFSSANAGSINQLHYTGPTPTQESWDSFYSTVLGGNDSIRVLFDDGYAQGHIVSRNTDVFKYALIDGIDTIYGVDESKAVQYPIVDHIYESHRVISAGALTQTQALTKIEDFGQICAIHDHAFRFNNSISSIKLQTNYENPIIGLSAFSDSAIEEATIDIAEANGSGQISGYGLNNNAFLRKLTYGEKVTAIAPSAMVNCRSILTSLHLPGTLTSIGNAAFAEFSETFPRLMDVNFNNCASLRTIGDYAFYNSISTLQDSTLSLHSNLTSIGTAAFAYDRTSWTQSLSGLAQAGATSIVGGAQLKEIGPSAFMYNSLRKVEFSPSLTAIDDYAFAYPKHKFDIAIKNNIQHIGKNAFYKNVILNPNNIKKNIATIDVPLARISTIMDVTVGHDYTAENMAGFTDSTIISATGDGDPYKSFIYVLSNLMHFCPQNLSIDLLNRTLIGVDKSSMTAYVPEYISYIGPSAFYGCTALTSVSAHEPLSIGNSAFYGCTSLKKIYGDPASNAPAFHLNGTIEDKTFYNCQKLSGIYILSNVTSIGKGAFYNCDGISSFFDDETLKMKPYWKLSSIGDSAFRDCSHLVEFDIPSALISIGDNVFYNDAELQNINIDLASDDFVNIVGANTIEDAIIQKFNDINSDGSTRINFLDVTYMNNGIVKIDNEFIKTKTYVDSKGKERTALTALNYADFMNAKQQYLNLSAISRVDQFVFNSITKLRSFNVLSCSNPDNQYCLEEIGDYAFNNCTNLMSINGGFLSCGRIGCYAFANCEKLLKLQLSYDALSSNSIGQGAFFGTSLNTLEIVGCPINIDNRAGYLEELIGKVKDAIGYDQAANPNPLELPLQCIVALIDSEGTLVGKYDSNLNDLLHASIDINRNALTFVDKTTKSIKPLLVVKPIDGKIPALAANTFHASIVGRWK